MKGFKVYNKDFQCRNFQYEIGKEYLHSGEISVCHSGFHFCEKLIDCFSYYDFDPKNKVSHVEATGKVITERNKSVTSQILIGDEISWQQVLELVNIGTGNTGKSNSGNMNSGDCNSGDMNSGDWNSGNMNSGDMNSGDMNSGDRNSGDRNSGSSNSGNVNSGWRCTGDWNSGNRNSGNMNSGNMNSGDCNSGDWNECNNESGYFNTENGNVRLFNKDSGMTNEEFYSRYRIPRCLHFALTVWINSKKMTAEEKKDNPKHETSGGYLKTMGYKESATKSISGASDNDKQLIRNLPNYDADVFEELFGIRI